MHVEARGLSELQDRYGQEWVPNKITACFSGRNSTPIGIRQLRDFIRQWNLDHPEKPIFHRRGAVEMRTLSDALKEAARPRPYRPRKKKLKARAAAFGGK